MNYMHRTSHTNDDELRDENHEVFQTLDPIIDDGERYEEQDKRFGK